MKIPSVLLALVAILVSSEGAGGQLSSTSTADEESRRESCNESAASILEELRGRRRLFEEKRRIDKELEASFDIQIDKYGFDALMSHVSLQEQLQKYSPHVRKFKTLLGDLRETKSQNVREATWENITRRCKAIGGEKVRVMGTEEAICEIRIDDRPNPSRGFYVQIFLATQDHFGNPAPKLVFRFEKATSFEFGFEIEDSSAKPYLIHYFSRGRSIRSSGRLMNSIGERELKVLDYYDDSEFMELLSEENKEELVAEAEEILAAADDARH